MVNPTWTNEEMTTSENPLKMRHRAGGIALNWTSEEDKILTEDHASFLPESSVSRYLKIKSRLQNKNVRDIAVRCRWIHENTKRRKKDHYRLGRAKVDNKEIIDMVVASQQFEPSKPDMCAGITNDNELIKQNDQWLSQISANQTSSKIMENLDLFVKIRKNIDTLRNNLSETSLETMKLLPLPEVNDDLFNAIFPSSNPP